MIAAGSRSLKAARAGGFRLSSDHWLNLLASAQVLSKLRYNDQALLEILGGQTIMIESPLLQELASKAEARGAQRIILAMLGEKFGAVPTAVDQTLSAIVNLDQLEKLNLMAATSPNMDEFRDRLYKFL